ncbi:hypothetical protein [Deinococcus apachensis]|nr:hypothetical protein [Deinococcus apachensis]
MEYAGVVPLRVEEHERHTFALGSLLTPKPLKFRSTATRAEEQQNEEPAA